MTYLFKKTNLLPIQRINYSSFPFSIPFTFLTVHRSLDDDDEDWTLRRQEATNLSSTINEILGSYDRKLRPNAGGESV